MPATSPSSVTPSSTDAAGAGPNSSRSKRSRSIATWSAICSKSASSPTRAMISAEIGRLGGADQHGPSAYGRRSSCGNSSIDRPLAFWSWPPPIDGPAAARSPPSAGRWSPTSCSGSPPGSRWCSGWWWPVRLLMVVGLPDGVLGWLPPAATFAIGGWLAFKLLAMGINTSRALEPSPEPKNQERAQSMEATGRVAGAVVGKGVRKVVGGRGPAARAHRSHALRPASRPTRPPTPPDATSTATPPSPQPTPTPAADARTGTAGHRRQGRPGDRLDGRSPAGRSPQGQRHVAMDLGIAGRRAAVAGASSGLGLATARALAAEGVAVAIGARSVDRLEEAAALDRRRRRRRARRRQHPRRCPGLGPRRGRRSGRGRHPRPQRRRTTARARSPPPTSTPTRPPSA